MSTPNMDVSRLIQQLTSQVAAAKEAAKAIGEIRGEGEAADGRIKVSVTATGALADVQLDPKVMRLPSEDIAAGILEASKQAQQDVGAKVRAVWSQSGVEAKVDIAASLQGENLVPDDIDAKLNDAIEAVRKAR